MPSNTAKFSATLADGPVAVALPEPALVKSSRTRHSRGDGRSGGSLFAHGEPMVWLSGGALALCLAMIVGLLALILLEGGKTFWPLPVVKVELLDGKVYMGEPNREESYTLSGAMYAGLPDAMRDKLRPEFLAAADIKPGADHAATDAAIAADSTAKITAHRTLYRTGNFELMNEHFHWISDFAVKTEEKPEWALIFERETNGRFYGSPVAFLQVRPWGKEDDLAKLKAEKPDTMVLVALFQNKAQDLKKISEVKEGDEIVLVVQKTWDKIDEAWTEFNSRLSEAHGRAGAKKQLEKHDIGALRMEQDQARLNVINAKLDHGAGSEQMKAAEKRFEEVVADVKKRTDVILKEIGKLDALNREYGLLVKTAENRTKYVEMAEVVRAYPANQLAFPAKVGVYTSRWGEFFFSDPREANSEGGVFPAIYGTVVMTLIMSFAVVPFGVLAALYLREYAKAGPIVTGVRIAVNNLAGVPSIVFGVFGLGFFCYIIGKYIDGGPKHGLHLVPWTSGLWLLGFVAWIALVALAIFVGIKSVGTKASSNHQRQRMLGWAAVAMWITAAVLGLLLIVYTPFFDGFFRAKLEDNKPTYGTGGLLWSSLTLALLTLPVVIVATEEALAAVPSSMREGSYACGASKWQTIKRIVLPRAMPGIMTGTILAMARGAGEVAPLMLVGVVKLAQELPVDMAFPFIHPERSFMHLGFHIYDVGFQSPNSKAAVPLVFTTTLLLILIIATLNIVAITMRTKLRRKFVSGHF